MHTADQLLEHLPVALLVIEGDGSILQCNAEAEEMLGLSSKQLRGRKLHALPPLEDLVSEQLLSGGRTVARNAQVTLHSRPIGSWGHTLVILHSRRIVSEQEARTRAAEVRKSAGMMASMLAHEVKNPLAGIRGAAQLLAAEGADDALAKLIMREVDRIAATLSRVEPFSEEGEIECEALNVHEPLRHAWEVVHAAHPQLTVEENFDPSLPPVMAHRDALVQIFLNLMTNAAEAMEGLSRKRVLRLRSCAHITGLPVEQGQVHVCVEDNGPGVPPHLREMLFEPFTSSNAAPGRGLGLAISAKLAESMGAQLRLLHTSEQGSCFVLSLYTPVDLKLHLKPREQEMLVL